MLKFSYLSFRTRKPLIPFSILYPLSTKPHGKSIKESLFSPSSVFQSRVHGYFTRERERSIREKEINSICLSSLRVFGVICQEASLFYMLFLGNYWAPVRLFSYRNIKFAKGGLIKPRRLISFVNSFS